MLLPPDFGIQGVILDMDGVLWKDTQPIGNLPAIFERLHQLGISVVLATNNATKTVAEYQMKLEKFDVTLKSWQIVNAAQAVAAYLITIFPGGGPVYVVGEPSLKQTLTESGFIHSEPSTPGILAVVAGMDYNLTFEKLRQATILIRKGLPFIGTNPDRTFPTPEGLMPGAGSVLAAIEAASDIKPIIAGKPSALLYELAIQRLATNPRNTLAIGDRLDTDILGGQNAGCRTAVVLSGVTSLASALAWIPAPDLIAPDLASIFF
jgi:4-nitrophenyl phosphatase